MKLTTKRLDQLEVSLRISLTPEQRLIMLYWYGHEPRYGWDEEDFVLGIHDVMCYYPDHRSKRLSDFLLKRNEAMEPTVRRRRGGAGQ